MCGFLKVQTILLSLQSNHHIPNAVIGARRCTAVAPHGRSDGIVCATARIAAAHGVHNGHGARRRRVCGNRRYDPAPPARHHRRSHPLPPLQDACCVTAAAAANPHSSRLPPPGTLRVARVAQGRRRASSTVWAASAGARVSAISASAVAVGSWCAGAGVGVGVEELLPRAELSAAASAPTRAAGAASPRRGTSARRSRGSGRRWS